MIPKNGFERGDGQVDKRMLAAIIVIIVILLAAAFLFYPKNELEPIPLPAPDRGSEATPNTERPLETIQPAKTGQERGDNAREVIALLKASPNSVDYAEAYKRARDYQAKGRSADALLLYFFSARAGYGPAAFDLATSYDPNQFSDETRLMEKPDLFQAFKWYSKALGAGNDVARERLIKLRAWAEDAVTTGNLEAEQLLLQWE